jgi:transposase
LVERREHEYKRNGALCLIANFEVATGEIASFTLSPTRTELDFADHIERTVAADLEGTWTFVADRLNTHMSATLVERVARWCGLDEELGKNGHLKSMESRAAFLSDRSHRIRFVYTPKHCSWLNQVEIWFSVLVRRLLRRGNFESLETLREAITKFIAYFNDTLAHPYRWTYTGRALKAT